MTVAHALALLPRQARYAMRDHQPAADAAALTALARWSLRLAPAAEPDPPDLLLLDVTGCSRLYGGEGTLRRHVIDTLEGLGFAARVAIAPCVGGAWALARFGEAGSMIVGDADLPAALAPLPVASLRLGPRTLAELAEVGIDTVEQLLDVPRDELASRFEAGVAGEGDVLRRLDEAQGRLAEPLTPVVEDDPPVVERAFAGPTTQYEAVELAARGLAEALAGELSSREAGARRLVLEVERLDENLRPQWHRESLTFSRPSREADHLWALLRPRVERLHLGHGVERLALRADRIGRLRHEQGAWDGEGDGFQSVGTPAMNQLVDLLQARLGAPYVLRAAGVDTHIPEAAFALAPANEPPPKLSSSARPAASEGDAFDPGDRPPRLLPRPEPARVTLLQPQGSLISVHWRGEHRITRSIGPQRIARRWWRFTPPGPPDSSLPSEIPSDADSQAEHTFTTPAARDYYKAQDHTGLWLWLYRNLLTHRWFVQGTW